jgi:hypothetical protein
MGRAYLWALPDEERAGLMREMREHYGSRWPRIRDGIERSGEMVQRHGFTISAGEWQNDVHAAGVALQLKDGTGPYAFNCGAPAFRFTEERLRTDIGPRLLAMVRNIELALGSVSPSKHQDTKHQDTKHQDTKRQDAKNQDTKNNDTKSQETKRLKPGGKVARVVEGIR